MISKTKLRRAWRGTSIREGGGLLVTRSLLSLTPGVLTKADMVTNADAFHRWRSIIAGEDAEHRLVHGYFLTMQYPASEDDSWKTEMEFLEQHRFWSKLDHSFPNQIGTLQLRKKLSIELSQLIKARSFQSPKPS